LEDVDIPGKDKDKSDKSDKSGLTAPTASATPPRVVVAGSASLSAQKPNQPENGGLDGLADKDEVILASGFLLPDVQRAWKLLQMYKVFHTVELGAKMGMDKLSERYPESGAITPVDLSKNNVSSGGQRMSMFGKMLSSKTLVNSKNSSSKPKKSPSDSGYSGGYSDYSGEATPQLASPDGGAMGAFSHQPRGSYATWMTAARTTRARACTRVEIILARTSECLSTKETTLGCWDRVGWQMGQGTTVLLMSVG